MLPIILAAYYGEPGYQPSPSPQTGPVVAAFMLIGFLIGLLIQYWIIRTAVLHALRMWDSNRRRDKPAVVYQPPEPLQAPAYQQAAPMYQPRPSYQQPPARGKFDIVDDTVQE